MGNGFEIKTGNISKITSSQGEAYYDSESNTLYWNPGTLTRPISEASDVNYAEIKYLVEINDDILKEEADSSSEYARNGNAKLSYIDADNNRQSKDLPVPKVNPVFYKLEKIVIDQDGNIIKPDENFQVIIKNIISGNQVSNEINPSQETRFFTDLRSKGNYQFEEVGENLDRYEISYYINGKETKDFTIEDNSDEDISIKVVNKIKPTELIVEKVDQGGNPLKGIGFKLSKADDDFNPIDEIEIKETSIKDDKALVSFSKLKAGKYILTEEESGEFMPVNSTWQVNVARDGKISVEEITKDSPISEVNIEGRTARVRITNTKAGFELPKTGGEGEALYRLMGILVLGFVFIFCYYQKRFLYGKEK